MVKTKKKAALSLEERLERALVPKAEQPYPVPENWCWTKFFTVLNYEQPTNYIVESTEYKDEYSIPVLTAGKSFILGYTDEILGICNDLPVIIFDDFTTDSKFVDFPFKVKSSAMKILRPATEIKLDFIYYYMQTVDCDNSEHRRFWISTYSQLPFPIPPLTEQQRIVDRIESLFTKLDEAKEKIQAALESFETRKAAILHKAFTGVLTAKWREENGVGLDSWFQAALSSLCKSLKYGTSKKSKEQGKVVVIRMGNLQQGEIDWNNLAYSDDEDDIKKYSLSSGDVLFNRTNSPELVGKTSIYRGNYPAIYAGYLIKLEYGKRLIGEYLNYMMNSSYAKAYCSTVKTDGVNQSNINAKKIGAFVIPVPSIPEQTEIVRLLDDFFAKEQKAKELCSVLDKIDLIKKSILDRAFRGELGTNDPTEESALHLLKSIV